MSKLVVGMIVAYFIMKFFYVLFVGREFQPDSIAVMLFCTYAIVTTIEGKR